MSSIATSSQTEIATPEWLKIVRGKVESLSYGIVQIVVHDHQVTQIERTEKTRLDSAKIENTRHG
jgi:hypothetical protein